MGVASDNFGHLLIPILLKQLPHNLVVEFHRKKDPTKTGDVNELMKFIKFEIESREAANAISGLSVKTQEMNRPKVEYLKNKSRSNLPTAAALNTIAKKACIFCYATNHNSIECKKFTPEQKRYKLKKEGRCYRCFYKHLQSACKVKIQPCLTCDSMQHNLLFCPKTKNKNDVSNQIPHIPEEKSNLTNENGAVMSSVLKSKNSMNNYTTLLQTACVHVGNGSSKIIARILYDSASTKTFIRQDLANKLKLKPLKKEKLCVYTFSKRNPIESEFDCVNITLKSMYAPHKFINVEALVTKEICGTQLYANIDNHLIQSIFSERCEFADLFDNNLPIQILLGGDVLYQTLNGQLRKINKQLFIQPTIFGNTVVGKILNDGQSNQVACLNVNCLSAEKDLTCLWNVESFLSNQEVKMTSNRLSSFENNLQFVNDRYVSPLLWQSGKMRFIKYSKDKSLWISKDYVKNYIKQTHSSYGGTFCYEGGVLNILLFDKLEIPAKYTDIQKPVSVLVPESSVHRCIYYKNWILINDL